MGKSSGKMTVDAFYMSQHVGVCYGPCDLLALLYGDKTFFADTLLGSDGPSLFRIDDSMLELHGGLTKEGGVAGYVYNLPGKSDQVAPAQLAERYGVPVEECSGFRSTHTLFFFQGRHDEPGFYWTANTPYLKDLAVTVRRKPAGMDQNKALIGEIIEADPTPRALSFALDCSTSMTGTKLATMKTAMVNVMEAIRVKVELYEMQIHLQMIAFGYSATDFRVATGVGIDSSEPITVEDVDTVIAWIEALTATKADTDFWLQVASPATNWFKFYVADSITNRYHFLITDGEPSRFLDVFATPQSIVDDALGSLLGWGGTGIGDVQRFSINVELADTTYSAQLDNTPEDGVPVISSADAAGLYDAVMNALFPDEPDPVDRLDANPANIIYECLTNISWGMGASEAQLDMDSFNDAQDTLFAESFGLSLLWNQQTTIQDFVQEILDHIQATLFLHPRTGLLTLKLIRGDYNLEDLPVISPDNATLKNFKRKQPGELVSEITVTWTNPDSEKEETVTVQDANLISIQGSPVSDSRNYYGVRTRELAFILASRDSRQAATPLFGCDVEIDRSLYDLYPGGVAKLVWPERGIDGVAVRLGRVDYGKPTDSKIRFPITEDIFGFLAPDLEAPPETEWTNPGTEPTEMDFHRILTSPYYFAFEAAEGEPGEYPEVISQILATDAANDVSGFDLQEEVTGPGGVVSYESGGIRSISGRAALAADLDAEVTSAGVTFASIVRSRGLGEDGFMLIGNDDAEDNEMEICLITGYDVLTGEADLARGVLDTVPRAWTAGTTVWFFERDMNIYDSLVRSDGETVNYKLLTRTALGQLSSAPIVSGAMNDRPYRPNRPADVKCEGEGFPDPFGEIDASSNGETFVSVTWAERNRLTEDSVVLGWADATVTPEAGQTTKIYVLHPDTRAELGSVDGLTGTSYDLPKTNWGGEELGIVRVVSERDGYESLTGYELLVRVESNFLALEDGDLLLLEDGGRIRLE